MADVPPRLDPAIWTPDYIADGRLDEVNPAALPMLAAEWLATDYDSEPLREVAGLSSRQGAEARSLFPGVLSSLGVQLQDPAQPGQLTRRQFHRTLEKLTAAGQAGESPRGVTQEVVTLWLSLPNSTHGEVTWIEDMDNREEALIVSLYNDYDDATDNGTPPGMAAQAAIDFWSTLAELVRYVQTRQV